jgi:formyltetrahydrofolate synthetase
VAVNRFSSDTDKEVELVSAKAREAGAHSSVMADHWYAFPLFSTFESVVYI